MLDCKRRLLCVRFGNVGLGVWGTNMWEETFGVVGRGSWIKAI